MSCSINSKGKSGPGAEPRWGSGMKPPEAGEKITPEVLKKTSHLHVKVNAPEISTCVEFLVSVFYYFLQRIAV